MGLFRRKVPNHYIPLHPDNIAKQDWIILLEAGTIAGHRIEKLRVALATLERQNVRKYNILLKPKHFLVLPRYDPRIPRHGAALDRLSPQLRIYREPVPTLTNRTIRTPCITS